MKLKTAQKPMNPRIAWAMFAVCYILILIGYGLANLDTPLVTISYTATGATVLALLLGVVIPPLLIAATRSKLATVASLLLLDVTLLFYFVYYVGPYSPFNFFWSVLIVACYYYTGRKLAIFSAATALGATIWSLVDYHPYLGTWVYVYDLLSTLVAVTTIVLAYVLIRMIENAAERARRLAESRQTEAMQLSRLNTLLNSISDTVLTLNQYGRVTSENSAALSFFDTNQSLVGKDIDKILDLRDVSMKPISVRELAKNVRTTLIRDDVSMTSPDAGVMRLSVQVSPIHATYQDNSGESGAVLIIRDITKQKALEDEKDEFISVTSHELRTPITIAEGSLSNLLFMFEKGAKPEVLKPSVVMAHDQILYLARMINDLSTLSRAERGVGDAVEEINLNDMLHELFLRYQPEAEAKGLALDLDIGKLPTISTSRLYLEEMLQNFITNAIKYTKEGKVTLSAHHKDGKVDFSVTDSGIGISKSDQAKIFDKFFRSEDYRTRETGGTGLGLYVVRKLADKLGTTVEVKSRLNHGSTFGFSLSAKLSDEEIASIEAVEAEAPKVESKPVKKPASAAVK